MGDDVPQIVTPVIETGEHLTDPVIEHTEKITRIEERQKQQEEKLFRDISELEGRLSNASQEQADRLMARIGELEGKLSELATRTPEKGEEVPEQAVDMVASAVERSPAPPEKLKRGIRARRKERRKKK